RSCTSLLRRPPTPPLFPYTTLFRSNELLLVREQDVRFAIPVHIGHGHAVADFDFGIHVNGTELGLRRFGGRQRQGKTQDREEKLDRKSTRLNSSHVAISYAVFCLKK